MFCINLFCTASKQPFHDQTKTRPDLVSNPCNNYTREYLLYFQKWHDKDIQIDKQQLRIEMSRGWERIQQDKHLHLDSPAHMMLLK